MTDDVPINEDQQPWWGNFLANSRLEKALTRSSMLQLILSRLSLFLDQLLLLERLSGASSIAASLKSIMSYIYQSHLIQCWIVVQKLPLSETENKWAIFLGNMARRKIDL